MRRGQGRSYWTTHRSAARPQSRSDIPLYGAAAYVDSGQEYCWTRRTGHKPSVKRKFDDVREGLYPGRMYPELNEMPQRPFTLTVRPPNSQNVIQIQGNAMGGPFPPQPRNQHSGHRSRRTERRMEVQRKVKMEPPHRRVGSEGPFLSYVPPSQSSIPELPRVSNHAVVMEREPGECEAREGGREYLQWCSFEGQLAVAPASFRGSFVDSALWNVQPFELRSPL